jgi:hypothetical protein
MRWCDRFCKKQPATVCTVWKNAQRWLLMTHDRAGADTFPLTQEFLSSMLAVRRATVNVATGVFKKAGLIRYVRGRVTVIDRHVLECASCDRHAAIERAYNCSENRPLAAVL